MLVKAEVTGTKLGRLGGGMAKRFTDTDKWKDPWFNDLEPRAKLTWLYLCDNCDHAGVWRGDFRLLSFHIGAKVTVEDFEKWFNGRVIRVKDKFFIRPFFDFQYGNSKDGLRAKQSAIASIEKLGLSSLIKKDLETQVSINGESLDAPSIGIGIGIGKERESEGKQKFDFDALYRDYPRKQGKAAGLKICKRDIKTPDDYEALRRAISAYRDHLKAAGTEKKFIKMFSTFMGEWRDWLDPDAGAVADFSPADNSSICGIAHV